MSEENVEIVRRAYTAFNMASKPHWGSSTPYRVERF